MYLADQRTRLFSAWEPETGDAETQIEIIRTSTAGDGSFGVVVRWDAVMTPEVTVERTADFHSWEPFAVASSLRGQSLLYDLQTGAIDRRFYRAKGSEQGWKRFQKTWTAASVEEYTFRLWAYSQSTAPEDLSFAWVRLDVVGTKEAIEVAVVERHGVGQDPEMLLTLLGSPSVQQLYELLDEAYAEAVPEVKGTFSPVTGVPLSARMKFWSKEMLVSWHLEEFAILGSGTAFLQE